MSDFEEIDKAAKALEAAKKKREQAQHQVIREENRLETEEKKQRSKRTHIVEYEQEGNAKADYGAELLLRLSKDLTVRRRNERNLVPMPFFIAKNGGKR